MPECDSIVQRAKAFVTGLDLGCMDPVISRISTFSGGDAPTRNPRSTRIELFEGKSFLGIAGQLNCIRKNIDDAKVELFFFLTGAEGIVIVPNDVEDTFGSFDVKTSKKRIGRSISCASEEIHVIFCSDEPDGTPFLLSAIMVMALRSP